MLSLSTRRRSLQLSLSAISLVFSHHPTHACRYINPELAEAAKERGNDAFRAQDWKTAINEYEDAIKRDPKNPAYHTNLAATLSKIMDFQVGLSFGRHMDMKPR